MVATTDSLQHVECPTPLQLCTLPQAAAVDDGNIAKVGGVKVVDTVDTLQSSEFKMESHLPAQIIQLHQVASPVPLLPQASQDHSPQTSEYMQPLPAAENVLGRMPLPPIPLEPLVSGESRASSSQSLSRRSILQHIDQHGSIEDQSRASITKARPLPPIGSTHMMEPMSPPGRRLPPLPVPSQGSSQDVVSLYSTSSFPHLSSLPGSTLSLPILPDPRYFRNTTPSNQKPHPPQDGGRVSVPGSRVARGKSKSEKKPRKPNAGFPASSSSSATSQAIVGVKDESSAPLVESSQSDPQDGTKL